jgi:hypothetical protein
VNLQNAWCNNKDMTNFICVGDVNNEDIVNASKVSWNLMLFKQSKILLNFVWDTVRRGFQVKKNGA